MKCWLTNPTTASVLHWLVCCSDSIIRYKGSALSVTVQMLKQKCMKINNTLQTLLFSDMTVCPRVCMLTILHTHRHTQTDKDALHSLGSCWSLVECSEAERRAAAAAAGVGGPGPLYAGVVGRADRAAEAPLAYCWYPKQLPIHNRETQQESLKSNKDLKLIQSDCSVITSLLWTMTPACFLQCKWVTWRKCFALLCVRWILDPSLWQQSFTQWNNSFFWCFPLVRGNLCVRWVYLRDGGQRGRHGRRQLLGQTPALLGPRRQGEGADGSWPSPGGVAGQAQGRVDGGIAERRLQLTVVEGSLDWRVAQRGGETCRERKHSNTGTQSHELQTQHGVNEESMWYCWCTFFQNTLQAPTHNTRLYCVTGKGEKDGEQRKGKWEDRGKLRGKKRAVCSEPKEGQSFSVTLVFGQAELYPTWEPKHTRAHATYTDIYGRDQAAEFTVGALRQREPLMSY